MVTTPRSYHFRHTTDAAEAFAAGARAQAAPTGPAPTADCQQKRTERHLLGAAHGLPVESLGRSRLCKGYMAHSRFEECMQAGVFTRLWNKALHDYDVLIGLNFSGMALDGPVHEAPTGLATLGRE